MDIIFNFNTVAAEQSSYWPVWIGVILTAVGAISAAVNSYFARQLHAETKRLREAQTEAKILVTFFPSEFSTAFFLLKIENIGNSTAFDVKMKCNKDFNITKERRLSEIGIFNTPFSLAPNQYYRFFILYTIGRDGLFSTEFSITVTYCDATYPHKTISNVFDFNMKVYEKMDLMRPKGVHDLVTSLENISKDTRSVINGSNYIRVRNFDDAELIERDRAWLQEQREKHEQG